MHFSYLLLKESVANDVINVPSFAGPVCCKPRHRRVEASVGLCYDFCSQNNNVEMAAL